MGTVRHPVSVSGTTRRSAVARSDDASVRSPSRLSRRVLVAAFAMVGFTIAGYLALYQLDVIDTVWDPFFGQASERVLTSSLSRALPVPDALLGAGVYLLEAVVELSGRRDRWYHQSWIVFVVGLISAGLALTGLGLVISQAVLGTFCTLCLASAATSFAIAGLVFDEVRAAVESFRPS
jgi:uncharacterized membrane protein